jgi:hypothetical protein
MAYMHLNNLYKDQKIMMFRECYALEKIHGSSAHIDFNAEMQCSKLVDGEMVLTDNGISFFSGGESHERFVEIFKDNELLVDKLGDLYQATVYGEVYGGKCQGMSNTYGKDLKFVAFDVKISGMWLSVPQAEDFCHECGLEFVDYVKIPTTIEAIDEQRDRDSVQAVRNGIGEGKKREGVVLRPLVEFTRNDGERVMSKHKGDDFKETKTPRQVTPEQLQVLSDAEAVADEWVTPMRIAHVLDKMDNPCMENMRNIIFSMQEDVKREGEGEIVWSNAVEKAIGRATAVNVKAYYNSKLRG